MARTRNSDASMTVDVNFGKIDKQKMQELSKQITEGLRSVEIDPKWMKTQKDLLKLQKEHSTILDKQSAIVDNITKTKGKHKLIVDQIKKLNVENKLLEVDTNKAIETRKMTEDELIKIQKKIQELKETGSDSDEDTLQIKKLEGILNKKLTTFNFLI
jgi:predicted nuclease with TOPRIM domain